MSEENKVLDSSRLSLLHCLDEKFYMVFSALAGSSSLDNQLSNDVKSLSKEWGKVGPMSSEFLFFYFKKGAQMKSRI